MRPFFLASVLLLPAASGCSREVNVHLGSAELQHVKGAPSTWPDGLVLHTGVGEEVGTGTPVAAWAGDDGQRVTFGYPLSMGYLATKEESRGALKIPGTWTFELEDKTWLTQAGKYVLAAGGGCTLAGVGILILTPLAVGPESDLDPGTVLGAEALLTVPSAVAALVGLTILLVGNAKFRSRPSGPAEGWFSVVPPAPVRR